MYKFISSLVFIFPTLLYAEQESLNSNLSSLLLFPFLFILMYFFLIRPQSKKAKEHKDLIKNLKINDEIVMQSGILGKIIKLTDQFAIVLLNENVTVIVKKESIVFCLPKGTLKQIK